METERELLEAIKRIEPKIDRILRLSEINSDSFKEGEQIQIDGIYSPGNLMLFKSDGGTNGQQI